ncbi:MCE family protein [Nocardioides sp. HM23]|uniref:MCE family protein n=1 Tax=Nocardioides bizhenqiangii TaxID=3095076 RepID=UPI002ACA4E1C|nr:MCE family protein [Nocardioides sp. HM23]MDZ5622807.1 MCE family protein [Nocardioides sp. HM23]
MNRRLRAGATLLAGAILLTGCDFDVYALPLPGGADVGDDPITVEVEFEDVLDLVPKSSVKVSDVTVGQVTDIDLDGYHAVVKLELRNDTGLPDNAVATIRQTSLLGEKFVSLAPPDTGASEEPLGEGDEIPLERTGRNPEVEEVLGALSLLLNGGGVAQLKTIATELNLALEGREDSAKSVFRQVESLMSQLDDHKADIVNAIESLNRLAISARGHQDSIDAALEELPSALDSIGRQRRDLVRMLEGLDRLSTVGVRVIRQTKSSTVDVLQQLFPVVTAINDAGDDFVESFHLFATFPFSDDVIGRDPALAKSLHFGDYVNLSIELDINLDDITGLACIPFSLLPPDTPLKKLVNLPGLCAGVLTALQDCLGPPPQLAACTRLLPHLGEAVCDSVPILAPVLCPGGRAPSGTGGTTGQTDNPVGTVEDLLDGVVGNLGLPRSAPLTGDQREQWDVRFGPYDADLALFLAAPVLEQEVAP